MTKACLLNLKTNALQCGSARTTSAACFVVHVLQPTFTISSADVSIYVDERARFYLSPMYCSVRVTAQGGVKLTSFQSERKICLYNCQPMFPLVFRQRCLLRSAEKSLKDTGRDKTCVSCKILPRFCFFRFAKFVLSATAAKLDRARRLQCSAPARSILPTYPGNYVASFPDR